MKLYSRSDLVLVGFLVSSIVIVLISWSASFNLLTPPKTATTLSEFADCMPAPQNLFVLNDKVVWFGEYNSGLFNVPSGPSCYVFDSKGSLIDWGPETGDGEAITRFLKPAGQEKPITEQQAIEFVEGS